MEESICLVRKSARVWEGFRKIRRKPRSMDIKILVKSSNEFIDFSQPKYQLPCIKLKRLATGPLITGYWNRKGFFASLNKKYRSSSPSNCNFKGKIQRPQRSYFQMKIHVNKAKQAYLSCLGENHKLLEYINGLRNDYEILGEKFKERKREIKTLIKESKNRKASLEEEIYKNNRLEEELTLKALERANIQEKRRSIETRIERLRKDKNHLTELLAKTQSFMRDQKPNQKLSALRDQVDKEKMKANLSRKDLEAQQKKVRKLEDKISKTKSKRKEFKAFKLGLF